MCGRAGERVVRPLVGSTGPMNADMPILFGSLLAVVVSLIWSRATTVGPVLFAWAGAAAGGAVAFFRHFDRAADRVDIEFIIPSAVIGAACGLLPGFAVRAAYRRGGPGRRAILEAVAAAALSAGLGMVFGWFGHTREEEAELVGLEYSVVFAAAGATLALVNWGLRRRRVQAD